MAGPARRPVTGERGRRGDAPVPRARRDRSASLHLPRGRHRGGTIPAFERVGLSLWGANRDPSVFSDPDVFDLHRPDVHRHLAFGHGTHFCLGASLGRLEARIMFERIARELPRLRLAVEPEELDGFRLHQGSLPLRIRPGAATSL
ncbi:cytochrome P450 [Nonomuraea thailandensis]